MISKKDLLEAWEKSMAAKEIYHESRFAYNTITDFLKSIPDDEPDAVNEHIRHGLEWAAKTVKPMSEIEEKVAQLWCLPQHQHKVMDVEFARSIIDLFREEMKKLGEEIKKNYKPPYKLGFLESCVLERKIFHEVVNEALKDRGVE